MSAAGRDPGRTRDSKPTPAAARTRTVSDPRGALLLMISYPARLWLLLGSPLAPANLNPLRSDTPNLEPDQESEHLDHEKLAGLAAPAFSGSSVSSRVWLRPDVGRRRRFRSTSSAAC
jgi:hypothetical protein